jgi:general secretion pathway protein B
MVYLRMAAAIVAGLVAAAALIGLRFWRGDAPAPEVAVVPDNAARIGVRPSTPTAQAFPTISLVRGPAAAEAVTVGRESTSLWPAEAPARERLRTGPAVDVAPPPAARAPAAEGPVRSQPAGASGGRPAELPANPY